MTTSSTIPCKRITTFLCAFVIALGLFTSHVNAQVASTILQQPIGVINTVQGTNQNQVTPTQLLSGCNCNTFSICITSQVNDNCYGGNNGSATVTASGGSMPYTYSWNTIPCQTTQTATGLSPGNYTVTVTDNMGCTATACVTITQGSQITIAVPTPSPICNGTKATLTVNGSTCISYTWTPSTGLSATTGSSVTADPTITTTYTVTGTTNNGCTGTAIVVVVVNPTTTINISTPSGICQGSCATLTVSGSPCTSYTWTPSTGLTITTGSSISACPTMTTTYTVTGSDKNGCPAKGYVVVNVNSTTTINIPTPSGICQGSCATLTVSGSPCTSYTWTPSTGLTITTGSSISACPTMTTTYTVTGSDKNGCPAKGYVVVNVNSTTTINIPTPSGICQGSCATLTVSGSPCTSYTWTPSTGLTITTGSSISACPTMTTTYTVTGSDHNGCPAKGYVVVNVNSATTINVPTPSGICQGSCATLTVSGSPCTSYTWTPSTGLTITTGSSISACPTTTTTYTVTGSDKNGCPAKGYVVVNVNSTTTINVPTPSGICQGSCAILTVSGSPCTSYTWTPSTGLTITTGSSISACPTMTTTYTVTGSDHNGCPAKGYVVVNVNPTTTINVPTPSGICQGSCATLTVSGSPCTSYTWTPSTGLTITTGSSISACPTTTTTYTVTGSDKNGCPAKGYVVVNVNSTTTINIPTPSGICQGSCATLTVSGSPCTSYTWTPSTGLTITTGSSISACPTMTTTYTVTGSDKNGCPAKGYVVVNVNSTTTINIPTPSGICQGSCATLTVSGSPCTSYTWTPSTGLTITTGSSISACPTMTTTYTVTGSDKNGCPAKGYVVVNVNSTTTINIPTPSGICQGSCATLTVSGSPCTSYTWTPSTGLTITTGSSISACPTMTTTYTVTGSDKNGCPAKGYVVVNVNSTTTINIPTPSGICQGSCATLTVSGSPCTSYTWTPSTGLTITTGSSISACPTMTTTYTVTGSDHNGCPAKGYVVVNVNSATTINVPTPSGICQGSCATLTVSGSPCTSYTWTPSTGLTITTGSSISACPTTTTTYTVTGSDKNGCPAKGYVVVNVNSTTTINVPTPSGICQGSCATLTVSGSPCMTYSWSPSTGLTVTTGSSISACPTTTTTYTVTGSDKNGCPAKGYVVVTVNHLQISVPPASACINDCANLTATGATSYTWSPATALSAITGSSVTACPKANTTYTVIGTNGSGCSDTVSAVVTIYPLPVLTLTAKAHSICSGSPDTIKASGASTYTWSPSTGLNVTIGSVVVASPTVTTTYTVIGTNANECVCNDTIIIKVNNKPVITLQPMSNTMCAVNGQCDGHTFKVLATGVNISYQWYLNGKLIPGATDTTYSFSPGTYADTGKYVVIVSNQCGSDTSDTALFILVNTPVIHIKSDTICYGNCATLTANGTDAIYYSWSPSTGLSATSGSSVTACPRATTTYTITATGLHGCTSDTTTIVTVNPKPVISVKSDTVCYGNCATLQATGLNESGTYTWNPSTYLNKTTGSTVTSCPTATTTYTIIGFNQFGCSDTTTAVVKVNPKPVISVKSDTVCYGNCATLQATGLNESGTYTWSPSTYLNKTTGSTVTSCPTATTTYTIIGFNQFGCSDTTTAVVKVNPKPVISVKSDTVCYGNCATLQATGLNESGTYTWSPSTYLNVTTGSTVTSCPTATTTYTIIGFNQFGCSDTTTAVVKVNPKPVISVKSDTVCYGNCATLQATGLNESGTYTWNPSTYLNKTTGSTVTSCPTATTTYTIIGFNQFGCSDTTTAVVKVNPKPVISVKSDTVCYGNCATLQATGLNESGTYTWSPSTYLNVTTGSTVTSCPTATTTYTIIGFNQFGCSDTTTAVVKVNPKPVISVKSDTVCYGNCATLQATGLNESGTYTWSPSTYLNKTTGSTVTSCPTATTTYTIIGFNQFGCSDTTTAVVKVNPKPVISVKSDTVCYGNCATLQATGLNESGTYTWSPSTYLNVTTGSTVTSCPTATTTYTIIGFNQFGCSDTTTAVVKVNPKPVISVKSDTVCYGNCATLQATGLNESGTYTWSPSTYLNVTTGSTVTSCPTATTTYTIIGFNQFGCSDTTTAVVKVNPKPVISVKSDTVCYGNCATLQATGLNESGTYTWSPSTYLNETTGSTVTSCPTATTTYTIIGFNQFGCSDTTTAVVKVNPKPVISVKSDTVCYGNCATLQATGLNESGTYTWSPSTYLNKTTGSTVTSCPTATTTYTIIGFNQFGCSDTTTAVVLVNPKPVISVKSDTVCYGNCATLQATGLNESGTYTWSPSTYLNVTTGSTVTSCPTATTTYTIIGFNQFGCSDTTTAVVLVNPKPVISVKSDTVCYGNCATLQATGLNESGTYTWSPSTYLNETTGSTVTSCPTATTTYTIIGFNQFGCSDTTTAVVKVNPKPVISVKSDTVCYGNCATLQATGLNESGTYTWSPSTYLNETTGSTVTSCPTATTTYTIIGFNQFGCSDTTTAVVKVNPKPVISVKSDTVCYGNCATLQATGLNESGTYTWSPSTYLNVTTGSTVTSCPTATTTYTIIGFNQFGCSDTTTAVVLVNPKPVISVKSDTVCYGNCATLQATGLNESGTYTWSPSTYLNETTGSTVTSCPTATTTYTIIGFNQFGCSDTTTAVVLVNPKPVIHVKSDTVCYGNCATLQATGLNESGTYTWSPSTYLNVTTGSTVTSCPTATTTYTIIGFNSFGCSDTTTAVVLVNPKPVIHVKSDTVCYGNCATLQATGLNESGTYTWSPSTYLNETTGSTVTSCPTATTTYTIIGFNQFGCSDTTTAVVKVNPKPVISVKSDTVCYGNCATLQATGLNESGTYTWSPSTYLNKTTGSTVTSCPTATTTYTIIGFNQFGCSDTTTAVVKVNPKPVISVKSDTVCYGNCATLQATGLNESGTYTWSPSTYLNVTTGSTVTSCPTATTTYTIIGFNSFGCSDTTTAVVLVNPKPVIHVKSDTVCYGNCATLQATGLNESGTYTWSPSTYLNVTTGSTVTSCPTATTTYTIIGFNQFGCSDTTTAVVKVNPKPVISVKSDTVCYGNCATLQATGLNESGTYTWSPSTYLNKTTGSTVTSCPTATTTYTIIGFNQFGCSDTTTAVVKVNPKPVISVKSDTVCYGNCATLQATGLNESGTYTWNPSTYLNKTTGSTVTSCPTATTTYTIIGFNQFGCSDTTTAVVKVNPKPVISVKSDTVCYGNCATLQATGLNESGTYTWSPSTYLNVTTGSTVTSCPTATTTYTIIGFNSFGCSDTTTAVVLVNPKPVIHVKSDTVCYGNCATLQATGLNESGTYTWSPSTYLNVTTGSTVTSCPTATTTYTIIGFNQFGCSDTTTAVVKVNPKPVISVKSDTVCYGNCATLQATGLNESGTYTWSPSTYLNVTTGSTVTSCPTATTTYTIIGFNQFGCSDTTTAVVLVNPKPVISVKSDTVCYGNCATLQATGLNESGTYTWSPSTYLNVTTGSTVTSCPTATTTYTIIGFNQFGCSDTTTAVVKVNPKPVISVKSDTVCYGNCATLQATGLNESGTYTWSPSTYLNETTGSTVTSCPTATTTYTIIGFNQFGCSDTTTAVVKVNPKPVISVKSDTVCYGNCATLQATGLNESGTYTWSPSTYLNVTTGSTVTSCPTATTTYTIIGFNSFGCSDTTTAVVLVNPKPVIHVKSDTVCYGNCATLQATGLNESGTYTWSPSTYLNVTTGSTVTSCPTATTTYTIIGFNSFGCSDTTTAVVLVNPKPVIHVKSDTVCYGNCATLQATGLNESGTYTWSPSTYLNKTTGSTVTSCPTATTTYTIIVFNQFGCSDTTTAVVLVIPSTQIITKLKNDTVCAGANVTFTDSATGEDLTYKWQKNWVTLSGHNSDTLNIPSVTLADSGIYSVIVSGVCGTDTSTATLKVNSLPGNIILNVNGKIVTNKPDSIALCAGEALTIFITNNNLNITDTIQWQKNDTTIAGQTTYIYTIPAVSGVNAGKYRAIVTSPCGADTSTFVYLLINSNTVVDTLTVNDSTITSKLHGITICEGSSATFNVKATGSKLTYQWQHDGSNLPGDTFPTYTIPSTVFSDSGWYDVIVTGTCGADTSYAHLKINSKPVITCQPKSESLCSVGGKCGGNGGVTFCVTATGINLSYQWQYDGHNIRGAHSSCYTINPVTISDSGHYDVIVSNSCGSDTSSIVVLTIGSSPVITSQPVCASVCSGSTATFCVTATGSNLTYQWQFNGKKINGANSSCYTIPSATSWNAGCYNVVISNSCGSVTSCTVTLTINTPPVITCQPKGESLCSVNGKCGGNDGVTFCVTATGNNLSYQWQYDGRNIHGAHSSCYTINPVTTSDSGNYDVIVSNYCGSDTSSTAVLTIGSSPVITSQPVCVFVCSGSTATFCVTATGSNLTYQWQFNGKNIRGANSCCYTIPSAAACNAGCYDVVVSNSCGSITSSTATLTISTSPNITCQPQGQTLCSTNGKCGGSNGVTFCVTATGSNLSYQWQYNGKNIHGACSSCYTINPVSTSNAGCYDVIVSNSCGSITSNTVTLTIGSSPVITSQPVCVSVCSGSTATFCVTATGSNITYQWQFNGKNISGANLCCYTIPSAASCNAGCYDMVVSNSCGSITSSTATLTISTSPNITCQPQGQTLCSTNGKCGGSNGVTFCVTATGSNLSYQWQYNGKNINGANSCCYTINPVSTSNAGCYDVIVSNSCGSMTSNTATLTIGSLPVITSEPSCLSLCLDNTATFCVTTTGSNLTYQWQFNGKNISGANSCCYTIESVAACNAGCYSVIVSNDCGSITSNSATLTVNNCSTCVVPTDLMSSDVTCTSVVLSWSYSSSASSFTVEYKANGCSTWSTKTVTSNNLTLTCLTSGTTYEWSVNENCSIGTSSGYASVVEFCTSGNCCSNNNSSPRGDGDSDNSGNDNLINDVKVYPNPTFSLTTVHATFERESDVTVMVTDIAGRIIMSENETAPAGDYIRQFDMSKQAQGTYFLIIRSGDQMVTSKIVKIE